ncbi:hypothetical protein P9273_21240, partial [Mesorhizobium sp. WSM4935]|uniref:hypothetical protein n=1 Tax=Mesorhizobium sp. WSM4935 TaxID=3038547 RepID=UPI002415422C
MPDLLFEKQSRLLADPGAEREKLIGARIAAARGAKHGVDLDIRLPRHARRRLAAMDAPGFEEESKECEIYRPIPAFPAIRRHFDRGGAAHR